MTLSSLANQTNPVDISHADEAIAEGERRNPVTMGLLWITMVTFFPGVLQGFIWFKEGLSFMQVVGFACSCLLTPFLPVISALAAAGAMAG
ncbi:MAG TPA: hypothetical protein PKC98_01120 [Candidatus Melainabacteria bacterium]|nr:hypothetical protein [Candidatus Melainabacteria bacterium]